MQTETNEEILVEDEIIIEEPVTTTPIQVIFILNSNLDWELSWAYWGLWLLENSHNFRCDWYNSVLHPHQGMAIVSMWVRLQDYWG